MKDLEKEKLDQISDISPKKSTKKIKKKKKKKQEKTCKNLKELLEQIKQENEEKLLKEKKQKEKTSAEEDKENKQRKESINTTSKSTSVATSVALSVDDYNFPSYLSINPNNNEISEYEINEEKFKKKKTSSPIVEYYNGFEKFWSKEYESPIDLTKSANYVDKKKFISLYELNIKKTKINPKETDVKDKNDKINKNNKYNSKYNSQGRNCERRNFLQSNSDDQIRNENKTSSDKVELNIHNSREIKTEMINFDNNNLYINNPYFYFTEERKYEN